MVGGFEPKEEQSPYLGVGLLQQKSETGLRNGDSCARVGTGFDEATGQEKFLDARLRTADAFGTALDTETVDDVVQDVVPLLAGVLVEVADVDGWINRERARDTETAVFAAAFEG